jgi:hypothetical protein
MAGSGESKMDEPILNMETPAGRCVVLRTMGITLPEDITYEEWRDIGIFLGNWKKYGGIEALMRLPEGWKIGLPAKEERQ